MKHAYALAIVVGCRPPVSSHVGDRAIVHADGRMEGFIGGADSSAIVRKAALEAIETGEPRLLTIDPVSYFSQGAIDVYIEPELPRSYLLIAGATPVARALGQIASKLDFTIVQFVKSDELSDVRPLPDVLITDVADIDRYLDNLDRDVRTASAAIAASQAVYDEPALTAFLKHGIGFTALVASPQRGRSVIDALAQWGVPRVDLDRVHYPAGIDIGAQRPGDVAISILAQIIAERRTPAPSAVTIVDPVCGMTVDAVASRDRAEFNGATYYFCGSHCSSAFAAEPEAYIVAVSKSRG